MNKRNKLERKKREVSLMLSRKSSLQKPAYPKLSNLKGLMAKYEITGAQLAKAIGKAPSTVSKSLNGWNLFDSNDLKNIQKLINQKETAQAKAQNKTPHYYSIDEIFYA
jgi:hypothetical protein